MILFFAVSMKLISRFMKRSPVQADAKPNKNRTRTTLSSSIKEKTQHGGTFQAHAHRINDGLHAGVLPEKTSILVGLDLARARRGGLVHSLLLAGGT